MKYAGARELSHHLARQNVEILKGLQHARERGRISFCGDP
jgi:hypothetical protein